LVSIDIGYRVAGVAVWTRRLLRLLTWP